MPPFTNSIRVRYNECDAQGAVFNANYLTYFDVTITELWRDAFGSYDEALQRFGVDLVVGETNVKYIRPARFDDELDIALRVEKLGTTSLTTVYDVHRDGEHIAEGRIRHVLVGLEDGKKRAIPDEMRLVLERYA
ncbi:MAG TPA: thioesterase family protein [Actinomycetota bacterium]|jgi:acyl-CoA thioester hydrolase|nr:thioesterase family protein [Actinomycetota bacterium]